MQRDVPDEIQVRRFPLDGARVKARRWALNLTQDQVGAKFGCARCRIAHLESGRCERVTGETLKSLARALDCAPESLLVREVGAALAR